MIAVDRASERRHDIVSCVVREPATTFEEAAARPSEKN